MDRILKLRMWTQNGVEGWPDSATRITEGDDKLECGKSKSQFVGKSVIKASRNFQGSSTRELGSVGDQSRQVFVDGILLWWW